VVGVMVVAFENVAARRARHLLRAIAIETVIAEPPPPVEEKKEKKPAKGKEPVADEPPPPPPQWYFDQPNPTLADVAASEAARQAEFFLCHVWGEPPGHGELYPGNPYASLKAWQVETAARRLSRKRLGASTQFNTFKLWVDKSCTPPPVSDDDHPTGRSTFGPFKMTVKTLWSLIASDAVGEGAEQQDFAFLRLEQDKEHDETMRVLELDAFGEPNMNPTEHRIQWTIPAGWYFLHEATVADQHGLHYESYPPFMLGDGPVEGWFAKNELRDQHWVVVTLGSVRNYTLSVLEHVVLHHKTFLLLASFHFFTRLWPAFELAVFASSESKGLEDIDLCTDLLLQPGTLRKYVEDLRKINCYDCQVSDERDRDLLLAKIRKYFNCETRHPVTYDMPVREPRFGCDKVVGTVTDCSALDRFLRFIGIVIAWRAMVLQRAYQSKEEEQQWTEPFVNLCIELGFVPLKDVLLQFKAHGQFLQADRDFQRFSAEFEEWAADDLMPLVTAERRLLVRPGALQV